MKRLTTKELARHIISASNATPDGNYVFFVKHYGKRVKVYSDDKALHDAVVALNWAYINGKRATSTEIDCAMKIYEMAVEKYNEGRA